MRKKLEVGQQLGSGIVGTFYKATLKGEKPIEYTLKVIEDLKQVSKQREFLRSIELQWSLVHPAILQLFCFSMPTADNDQFSIVTEFVPNGFLKELLAMFKKVCNSPKSRIVSVSRPDGEKALIVPYSDESPVSKNRCNKLYSSKYFW